MARTDLATIQLYFPNIELGSETPVTDDEITDEHIPAAAEIVDSYLRRRWNPDTITDSGDVALLTLAETWLAVGIVGNILYSADQGVSEGFSHDQWTERAEGLLESLVKGEMRLATASTVGLLDLGVLDLYEPVVESEFGPQARMTDEF